MFESLKKDIRDEKISVTAIAIFVVLVLLAWHIRVSTDRFAQAYRNYAVVANISDIGALVPGAANNPVRLQINDALNRALADKMGDQQRLDLAKKGLNLMQYSKGQIDAITPKLDATDASEKDMASSVDFVTSIFANGLPQKIIALSKERAGAISDIRAYSYRADFETQKIFEHIIGDNGALPSSYVEELNSEIPAAEQDFNSRQNRYYDLQNISDEIDQNFAEFAKRFSIKNTGE
jgi:hypothetical protein